MKISLIKPGLGASIQDVGRVGFQSMGVPVSGVMDPVSASIANWLCGNPSGAAVVEQVLHGQVWAVLNGGTLALCGGGARVFVGQLPLPMGRAVYVPAGCTIECKQDQSGCRAYLAMGGGISADSHMGSLSTYTPAGLGGLNGGALRAGDLLESGRSTHSSVSSDQRAPTGMSVPTLENWGVDLSPLLFSAEPIRFMRGPEFDWFGHEEAKAFMRADFQVSNRSNRMGYHLEGPLLKAPGRELLSTAVTRGTIQITHAGSPVVLMADAQTIGGYPRIGQVAAVDLPRIAQMRPGQQVRFREISWEEAEKLYFEREKWMAEVAQAISIRRAYQAGHINDLK